MNYTVPYTVAASPSVGVPEPGVLTLLMLGLGGLHVMRRVRESRSG